MDAKHSRIISIIIGLAVSVGFLYFTFRGTALGNILDELKAVHPGYTLALVLLSLLNLGGRGLRWWLLVPSPRRPGELTAAMRALTLSYGINNVASRIGELARLFLFRRETGRGLAEITSTVVVDRVLFDFVMTAAVIAYATLGFRDQLGPLFPGLQPAMNALVLMTLLGIAGLLLLAWKPEFVLGPLRLLGLSRFPAVDHKIQELVRQFSAGLAVFRSPRQVLLLSGFNLLVWAAPLAYLWVAMAAFGIQLNLEQTMMLFAVATLSVVLPAPGGLGTTHFFLTTTLVHLLAVNKTHAAAAATYNHGLNYLVISIAAVAVLMMGGRQQAEAQKKPAVSAGSS